MKRLIIPIVFTALLFSGAFFGGCYTDTIDSLSTFTFQLAIPFHSTHYEKAAPDTSYDFTNLNAYKEYRDNRERIKKAMILEFNYWVDSIVMRNADPDLPDIPYDPEIHGDTISFEFVKFYLRFAKLKPGAGDPLSDDSTHWMMDPNEKNHLLGEFYEIGRAHV